MNSLEIVEEALVELKMQKRLIKRAFVYDPTLYRSWVQAVLPSLTELLKDAKSALEGCTHPEDIAVWDNHVALAKAILGKK
jgi:hypothetical protein